MAINAMNWPLVRCVAYLRRIADALDRLAPPAPTRRSRVRPDFSVATTADFDRGWDSRNVGEESQSEAAPR